MLAKHYTNGCIISNQLVVLPFTSSLGHEVISRQLATKIMNSYITIQLCMHIQLASQLFYLYNMCIYLQQIWINTYNYTYEIIILQIVHIYLPKMHRYIPNCNKYVHTYTYILTIYGQIHTKMQQIHTYLPYMDKYILIYNKHVCAYHIQTNMNQFATSMYILTIYGQICTNLQ